MAWATGLRLSWWQSGRSATRAVGACPTAALELARTSFVAGETVVGRVLGVVERVTVTLVRVERRPCADRAVVISEGQADPDGTFELAIPPGALPNAFGAGCSLSYVAQVGSGGAIVRAPLEISAIGS